MRKIVRYSFVYFVSAIRNSRLLFSSRTLVTYVLPTLTEIALFFRLGGALDFNSQLLCFQSHLWQLEDFVCFMWWFSFRPNSEKNGENKLPYLLHFAFELNMSFFFLLIQNFDYALKKIK